VHAREFEEGILDNIRKIEDRIKQNIATQDERDHYALLERMGFFYKLMMNEVIEKYGTWRNGTSNTAADGIVRTMAHRAAEPAQTRQERVFDLLTYALDQRILEYHQDQEEVRWEWVEQGSRGYETT
jgi:hypothetical protein